MPVINMPKLSDTMTEGTLVRWLKKEGETVVSGDILAEVETDKATMEMESFDDGVLKELYVKEGGKVAVGQKIALVLADGESADTPVEIPPTPTSRDMSEGKEVGSASTTAPTGNAQKTSAPAPAPSGRVKASPLAKKIATERGVSLEGVSGTGPGGRVVSKDVPASGSA
ncbi:MAG: biotin/lipoyl-containing protein, partial [Chthoniobacterales bacterium]